MNETEQKLRLSLQAAAAEYPDDIQEMFKDDYIIAAEVSARGKGPLVIWRTSATESRPIARPVFLKLGRMPNGRTFPSAFTFPEDWPIELAGAQLKFLGQQQDWKISISESASIISLKFYRGIHELHPGSLLLGAGNVASICVDPKDVTRVELWLLDPQPSAAPAQINPYASVESFAPRGFKRAKQPRTVSALWDARSFANFGQGSLRSAGGYSVQRQFQVGEGSLKIYLELGGELFSLRWEFELLSPKSHLLVGFRDSESGQLLTKTRFVGNLEAASWSIERNSLELDLSQPWTLFVVVIED